MEVLPNCCHTAILDRSVATGTSWTELVVIVLFTVGTSVPLKKVPVTKLRSTLTACIVLWMPHFAQSDDYLSDDGLSAMGTVSFRDRRDAMLTAVLAVQSAQHRVSVRRIA